MEQIAVESGSVTLNLACGPVSFGREVYAAAYYPEAEVYLVLLAPTSTGSTEEVVGIDRNGRALFSASLPDGWQFYYFSSHVDYPLAIVCTSGRERFDWYWGIEAKQGGLVSLNRAY